MVTNGHQPAEEAGWDAALLDQWRAEAGYAGVHYLEVLPGKPKLAFDLTGLMDLVLQGRLPNSMFARAQQTARDSEAYQETRPQLSAEEQDRRFWQLHEETRAWHDDLVAATWVSPPNPPWCKLGDLPPAGRPRGSFCLHDIQPPARLRMLVELLIGGAAQLDSFRDQSARLAAAQDVPRLRPAAQQPADPPVAGVPALPVRRGDLVGGDDAGPGAPGGGPGEGEPAGGPHPVGG